MKNYGITKDGRVLRTQEDVVLYALEQGTTVTQLWANEHWGFSRLSAIIFDIKDRLDREGSSFRVRDRICSGANRFGVNCHWKEYYLENINEPINS